MTWLSRASAALRRWLSRDRAERELHDDVESYARLLEDEQRAAGVSGDEARRRARIELGGVAQVEEAVRQHRTGAHVEQTWQDVRYAVRGLRRTPGFTATVILTLGLGMGLNSAVFSVADAALFRPLPYERADALVHVEHLAPGDRAANSDAYMTGSEMRLWLAEPGLFDGGAAYDITYRDTLWPEQGRIIHIGRFTAGTPQLLGVTPLVGRSFTTDEVEAGAPVLLLSEDTWTRAFNRDTAAIGASITFDSKTYTVIGVMPRAFRYGPAGGGRFDAWTGLSMRDGASGGGGERQIAVFRLHPGISMDAAQRMVAVLAGRIQRAEASPGEAWTASLVRISDDRYVSSGAPHRQLVLLLTLTGIVLLIACANAASLLTVRARRRERELGMRSALGATRARMVRFLLIEGAVIAAIGSAVAIACAAAGAKAVFLLMPPRARLAMFEAGVPSLDGRVVVYSLLLGMAVTLIATTWPAVRNARASESALIPSATPARGRVSEMSQIVQIAMAFVLVTGAALSAASFSRTVNHDLGFRPDGLGWVTILLPPGRFRSDESRAAAAAGIVEKIRRLPGVTAAAMGQPPLQPVSVSLPDQTGANRKAARFDLRLRIGPGYFTTIGLPIVAGRDFSDQDTAAAERVIIIDESAARWLFPGSAALDRRVRSGLAAGAMEFTVIGIVKDASTSDFNATSSAGGIYWPLSQMPAQPAVWAQIHAATDIGAVLADASRVVAATEADAVVAGRQTVAGYLDAEETFSGPRFYLVLTNVFAALALFIASIGIYGALSFRVAQRQREIGVRIALGASMSGIRRLIIADATRPILAGLTLGWIAAWWLARFIASFLYGVSSHDLGTFAISGAVLLIAGLIAAMEPMRRATGVDPIAALRGE